MSCSGGWTLPEALKQLTQRRIAAEDCMPYRPPDVQNLDAPLKFDCNRCALKTKPKGAAASVDDAAAGLTGLAGVAGAAGAAGGGARMNRYYNVTVQGRFNWVSLAEEWTIARHVR